MKINPFIIYKGGGSGEKKKFFKKIKQNGGFSLFFFFFFFFLLFGKAPYVPKIMSLLPTSPKIITSAPKLHENKIAILPRSPKPLGAPLT